MKKLIAFVAVVALAAPGFARDLDVQEMDNGDGSYTYWISIDSLPEVSFLEMWIHGNIHQIDGGPTYANISQSPWAPSVVFTSDAALAAAVNPEYDANSDKDTVIDDELWPGKVDVQLEPNSGDGATDGTESVHIALTSFTGGLGGALPGGLIPLAHITTWGRHLHIEGRLQSDSDTDGSFHFWVPEPSTAMLAAFGLMGLFAGMRRRS